MESQNLNTINAYQKLLDIQKEVTSLTSASMLLAWDQETNMPTAAGLQRAESLSALASIIHAKSTSPELGEVLEALSGNSSELSSQQRAVVREWKRQYKRQIKLPPSLVEELSKTTSLSQQAWSQARSENNSELFLPYLEKIIELSKEAGEHLKLEGQSAYDALLDEYEPGAKGDELAVLFKDLVAEIVPLLRKVESRPEPKGAFENSEWDTSKQEELSMFLLTKMGFDFERGRLDVSEHPFTEGLNLNDVRLTTRYSPSEFFDAFFSTAHEGGHGIYEQGFSAKWIGTPIAESISLGVHESQSRLWENQVARSREFWIWMWPELKTRFPENLNGVEFDTFYRVVNKVKSGEIRVDADELTYNLHIALRFQIEREIFNESLKVSDIEARWNELSDEYLGLLPSSPMRGFLQDVHWSVGLFGYFPTYTLGNLMSAQIFNTVESQIPQLKNQFQLGKFEELKLWLNQNIHRYGKFYSSQDLMVKLSGEKLNAKYFTDYLQEKYSRLYELV